MTTPTPTPTARDARLAGEDLGLTGEALDLWVRAGAQARAAARTEAAWTALVAAAGSGPAAVILAALDSNGTGGPLGAGGPGGATLRVPALRQLGKGRRQARDGAAWTAAINTAARGWLSEHAVLSADENQDGGHVLVLWRPGEGPLGTLPLTPELAPWFAALSRRAIVAAARGEPGMLLAGFVTLDRAAEEVRCWARLLAAAAAME